MDYNLSKKCWQSSQGEVLILDRGSDYATGAITGDLESEE